MPGKRARYSSWFREEAAKMAADSSRPIAEAADEIGVPENTLRSWVKKYRADRARVRELEAQVRELRLEHDELKMEFIKKTMAANVEALGEFCKRVDRVHTIYGIFLHLVFVERLKSLVKNMSVPPTKHVCRARLGKDERAEY